jgi:hypothetical protein
MLEFFKFLLYFYSSFSVMYANCSIKTDFYRSNIGFKLLRLSILFAEILHVALLASSVEKPSSQFLGLIVISH